MQFQFCFILPLCGRPQEQDCLLKIAVIGGPWVRAPFCVPNKKILRPPVGIRPEICYANIRIDVENVVENLLNSPKPVEKSVETVENHSITSGFPPGKVFTLDKGIIPLGR